MTTDRLPAERHHYVAEVWHDVTLIPDPFNAEGRLCIDGRAVLDGIEFHCTGHEHRHGLHTLCTSTVHYHDPADCPLPFNPFASGGPITLEGEAADRAVEILRRRGKLDGADA